MNLTVMPSHDRLALDATILAAPSNFEFVVYGAQWLPFPMTHADLVIHARWTDLSEVLLLPLVRAFTLCCAVLCCAVLCCAAAAAQRQADPSPSVHLWPAIWQSGHCCPV